VWIGLAGEVRSVGVSSGQVMRGKVRLVEVWQARHGCFCCGVCAVSLGMFRSGLAGKVRFSKVM